MAVAEAFYYAALAMATVIKEQPFPIGLNTAEVGDWKLSLNTSTAPVEFPGHAEPLGALTLHAESTKYLAFGIFDPTGGMIGGMSEDEFIAEMKKLAGKE